MELDGRSVFVNEVIDVRESGGPESRLVPHGVEAVSYTHLTLPTSDLV